MTFWNPGIAYSLEWDLWIVYKKNDFLGDELNSTLKAYNNYTQPVLAWFSVKVLFQRT